MCHKFSKASEEDSIEPPKKRTIERVGDGLGRI